MAIVLAMVRTLSMVCTLNYQVVFSISWLRNQSEEDVFYGINRIAELCLYMSQEL